MHKTHKTPNDCKHRMQIVRRWNFQCCDCKELISFCDIDATVAYKDEFIHTSADTPYQPFTTRLKVFMSGQWRMF